MADDRYRGGYNRPDDNDQGRDYGSGRDFTYSSARDYAAAGERMGDRSYGQRDYGNQGYEQRERMNRGQWMYGGGMDRDRDRDRGRFDDRAGGYYQGGQSGYQGGQGGGYRGSYASDGRRFTETDRGDARGGYDRARGGMQGRDDRDDDRGFFARAGDEVRSWFGDDEAERRRESDERSGASRLRGDWAGDRVHDHRDRDYHSWRESQVRDLDRDYDEYRRENQSKFHNEFSSWRTNRQGQRQMLNQVEEHAEVVGSDGQHVGTVDKVRGDRIVLTKNDADAGGRHHSIPCGWLQSADAKKVTLNKSSVEAKTMWRDEERQGAMFGDDDKKQGDHKDMQARDKQGGMLNRSFSGTYEDR